MAGGGNVTIRGANQKKETQGANVTNHMLWVTVQGGGLTVTGPLDVILRDDANDRIDITPTGAIRTATLVAYGDVGATYAGSVWPVAVVRDDALTTLVDPDGDFVPLRVNDVGALWVRQSADVEVVQPTRGDFNANTSLQLQGVDVVASSATAKATRVPVTEHGSVAGLPNVYFNIAGVFEIPGMVIVDPNLGSSARVSNINQALATGPRRSAITQVFNAQVFDNATTSANSSTLSSSDYRWGVVYIDLASAGAPVDIRLILQFSRDGGTTWHDWTIDQWVDLRYVPGQMPLKEVLPMDLVTGALVRIRAVASGTTAVNTFTLSTWVELIT